VKRLTFCYGHRIRGHAGRCRHLHGHNAQVEIECRGPLDGLGMVVDFAEIRDRVERWIRDNLDHRMVLAGDDPLVEVLRAQGEPVYALDAPPTAENLARLLFEAARDAGLPVTAVRFWETGTAMAAYEEP